MSISSLTVLEEANLAVNFRSYADHLSRSNTVNANVMVQIAVNQTLKREIPKKRLKASKKVRYSRSRWAREFGTTAS